MRYLVIGAIALLVMFVALVPTPEPGVVYEGRVLACGLPTNYGVGECFMLSLDTGENLLLQTGEKNISSVNLLHRRVRIVAYPSSPDTITVLH